MKQHPPSAFIAGKKKNKKIRIRGQNSKADNTLCIRVNNNIKVISVYKVTHSQAMCLLHHHKHITILVLHEIIFCIALLLPAMWFIPPPDTAQADAVSTKTRGNSGINGDQLRRRYENVKRERETERGDLLSPQIWMNSCIPRWNRGLCIVIWSFCWYTYLMFFTLCSISACMPYLLGQTREVGVVGGRCVLVCSRCRGVWCAYDEWDS